MISKSRLAASAAAIALSVAYAAPAFSQPVLEEIVVTARKREEKLNEIPLSITAFSAADIEKKGFKGLEDLAKFAPGIQYSNQGGQIPGRYTSAIRFRGMNVNSDSPSLQLGSLFVDGVYVLGGTQSIPLNDVERVEVIKGPQSAYFGRNTFGGAVNYITKNPSTSVYSGKISASGATYDAYDVSASHEGPLVQDKLAYRVGARLYSKGSMFTASDGGKLGEESSKSINATFYATPTDNLKIKARAFYDSDSDGPAAGGLVPGYANDSCTGKTITTQDPAAPTLNPRKYICGQVPVQGNAISAVGTTRIIDTNTSLRSPRTALQGFPNFLIDSLVNRANPAALNVPFIDHIGLERRIFRLSGNADYEFADGYTATIQGGYNRLRASWIRDFGLTAIDNWYSKDPQDAKDRSFEARITSPQDKQLKWLVGGNYYKQDFIQSGSGGDVVDACTPTVPTGILGAGTTASLVPGFATNLDYRNLICRTAPALFTNTLLQNTDKIKAKSVFASITYDITDQIQASVEGRYLDNKASTAVLTPTPITKHDKNWLPRAILKFQADPTTNIYASYAKGVIQGSPNAQIATATARELAQYKAAIPNVAAELPAESLNMFELGLKKGLFDNRANVNIATYYGKWKNQKGRGVVAIQEDCGSPAHGISDGCVGFAGGGGIGLIGQPATNVGGTPFFNLRNVNVVGTSKLWGAEFEGAVAITDGWDAKATMTYARSKYTNYLANFLSAAGGVAAISGNKNYAQMKGNSNPRFPKWSGSLASTYTADFNADWKWFIGGDLIYVGKTFVDEPNFAFCKDYWTANTRLGVERPGFRIETFVKNVFQDKNWTACARWSDFDSASSISLGTFNQGAAVSPQDKRQFGLRTSIEF